MLTLEGLQIVLGDFALSADLQVAAGARVAVMGPSGAGKSTLLAAIGGFLPPASGRIRWDGSDITAAPPAGRPMAYLFQDNNLFPHLSASQNVALGVRPSGRLSAPESAQVAEALGRVGLEGLGDRKPGALSGGQQGRVALARVLVQRKPVVLLDEPFAALGPALKAEMIALLIALAEAEGQTVLMVTHDPADARRLGDKAAVVADGTVTGPVGVAALLDDPPDALRAYLGRS